MVTTTSDPRTIVTPDAFSVDPPLLGTPLARPWRRGVAVLIDVLLVALITTLTSGFWFILGVVAAAFFFTRASKPGKKDRTSKVFRFFLGCMGVMALSLTAVVFLGIRFVNQATDEFGPDFSIEDLVESPLGSSGGSAGPSDGSTGPSDGSAGPSGGSAPDGLRSVLGGLLEGAQLRSANDPDEAVALAVSVGRRLQELSPAEEVEDLLRDIIPQEVGDVGRGEILARAMTQLSSPAGDEVAAEDQAEDLVTDAPDSGDPPDSRVGAADVDQADTGAAGPPELELADMALAEAIEVAGDTIGELERNLARARGDLDETRAQLDEALTERGLIGWLTSRIDSLGFGFGWWTLYFAILMPWMNGQTPGKRAMGVRVVRLDGQPVTWWHAFERAGGYAAGVATGTLGFAQIYWDANRQAIHDKVAGTVVIRDGAPKVPGHWDQQVKGGDAQPREPGSA